MDAPRWVYADKQQPSIHGAMAAVSNEIRVRADAVGISKMVLELVNLRSSQINGCAFCLHLHTHLALRGGESPQRIAVLPAWREADLFTEVERAALTIAEAVTRVSEGHLTDDQYDLLREILTDDQLALLIYAASMINAFNRVSILSHHPVTHRESFGTPVTGGTHGP
ncbi:carboxymuconolactone decarboxylase [Knoellia sinensis KCTC 19936]|uniref:Carboxymuconolactone decarboxylase n=1 Tax=Knoellia sinensis KCTC 19936 TaxID=1385520 RepID=A0A0A0JAW2_9MICO|nr:carboxymuconolactone decarboxylase family protein [Knoellia sinensis]KGN34293.1 carboxymuconolactone decarboxylase [Knoellia sinensis KCTC 19936]